MLLLFLSFALLHTAKHRNGAVAAGNHRRRHHELQVSNALRPQGDQGKAVSETLMYCFRYSMDRVRSDGYHYQEIDHSRRRGEKMN